LELSFLYHVSKLRFVIQKERSIEGNCSQKINIILHENDPVKYTLQLTCDIPEEILSTFSQDIFERERNSLCIILNITWLGCSHSPQEISSNKMLCSSLASIDKVSDNVLTVDKKSCPPSKKNIRISFNRQWKNLTLSLTIGEYDYVPVICTS
jgi:hypothetical protein